MSDGQSPPPSASERLFRRAREVMPGGCSRATIYFPPFPIYAKSAFGCYVRDVDGVDRIDFVNNMSSLIHGHNHPVVNAAVKEQLDRLTAAAMPTEQEVLLAAELCNRVPSAERVIFTNSGTEAVMMAIRAARAYTGRTAIAKAEGAYHGAYDAVEVSVAPDEGAWGEPSAPAALADTDGIPRYVQDDVVVFPFNDIEATERLIVRNKDRLACVLIDPVVTRAGLIRGRSNYLSRVRELTAAYGIVLIFDEVLSFRLGYHGAQGQSGVTPDLSALGKIIGGGFPVGAVAGAVDIMSVFDVSAERVKIHHGGTYNANPISMAAGLATLQMLAPPDFDRLGYLGLRANKVLSDAVEEEGIDGFVRSDGSLLSLFFGGQDSDRFRDLPRSERQTAMRRFVHRQLLDEGVVCTPFAAFILSTAMSEHEIDALGQAAARVFRKLKRVFP